jgi:hypothetical protein
MKRDERLGLKQFGKASERSTIEARPNRRRPC